LKIRLLQDFRDGESVVAEADALVGYGVLEDVLLA
jgi:hypothetical protein